MFRHRTISVFIIAYLAKKRKKSRRMVPIRYKKKRARFLRLSQVCIRKCIPQFFYYYTIDF